MTPDEAMNAIGKQVVARYSGHVPGDIGIHGRGKVVAYSIVPTLLIEREDGTRFSWRHDMVEEVTAAEQTVARMDTYSQEEHARCIEDARERIAKRRAVRRNRAEAAAKYRAHVASCPREDHGTACLPDEGES